MTGRWSISAIFMNHEQVYKQYILYVKG